MTLLSCSNSPSMGLKAQTTHIAARLSFLNSAHRSTTRASSTKASQLRRWALLRFRQCASLRHSSRYSPWYCLVSPDGHSENGGTSCKKDFDNRKIAARCRRLTSRSITALMKRVLPVVTLAMLSLGSPEASKTIRVAVSMPFVTEAVVGVLHGPGLLETPRVASTGQWRRDLCLYHQYQS